MPLRILPPRTAKTNCLAKLKEIFRDEFQFKSRCGWGPKFFSSVWEAWYNTDQIVKDCHQKSIQFSHYGNTSLSTGWEIGHRTGLEWKRITEYAELYVNGDGNPQAAYAAVQFIHKTPSYFQPENWSDNRSHKNEYKGSDLTVGHFLKKYCISIYNNVIYTEAGEDYHLSEVFHL